MAMVYKSTGRQPAVRPAGGGDLHVPDQDVMGAARPESVDFVKAEELSFGPPDSLDTEQADGEESEMMSEVKVLVRVINESQESKDNFEMLFRLIIQKYQFLSGDGASQQINQYLLTEAAPQLPFTLTVEELHNYWTNN